MDKRGKVSIMKAEIFPREVRLSFNRVESRAVLEYLLHTDKEIYPPYSTFVLICLPEDSPGELEFVSLDYRDKFVLSPGECYLYRNLLDLTSSELPPPYKTSTSPQGEMWYIYAKVPGEYRLQIIAGTFDVCKQAEKEGLGVPRWCREVES